MNTSLFELFKIGIGPSSSHTVGPMRAALRFVRDLEASGALDRTASVVVHLYGSLALTGIGHGTDRAILLGLLGEAPDTLEPTTVETKLAEIRDSSSLPLLGRHRVPFSEPASLPFHRDQMYPTASVTTHPNGMRFTASDASGALIAEAVFYSVGGGFIVTEAELASPQQTSSRTVPYPFRSAAELLGLASHHDLSIADLLLANEVALLGDISVNITRPGSPSSPSSPEETIKGSILALWHVMQECTTRGIATEGILPGGLNVRRRAHRLAERLNTQGSHDPLAPIDWVTVWAMAVNEENAAGGRVVTAPTNGAAGIIPAIAHYYVHCVAGLPDVALSQQETEAGLIRYFLTAAAIGILYKENASISGAEVGCQGEVGVACSMAAGGLVAALGGTNAQIEHAAEIAMEHNLGMTCDPIGGLVQIPCIERNGMGAVKAINASRMAMHETEGHKLSLDQVIATMYQTGLDMQSRYKETSLAGLALNIIEC
ncbi:L-serine ammonia-lyase [Granulicella aggregans]|uniref:L-serine ammonia-lyase n=1 Tax=Granulicella aggregans TaxID=474949 RepID=UPI0021E026C1|nr:L-serine ammonia-lyase [Granulicella aggregans]